jgi:Phosphoesterase family
MSFSAERAFDRVLVVMFENQYRSYVLDNPFFRRLARQGIQLDNYNGVMHPSQTNYIAAIAGELCGVTQDDPPRPLLTQRMIVDLLEEAQLRWKGYMENFDPAAHRWSATLEPADACPYCRRRRKNAPQSARSHRAVLVICISKKSCDLASTRLAF